MKRMKKKNLIALIIFVVCVGYLAFCAVSNAQMTEEEKIIDAMYVPSDNVDNDISELVMTKETESGVLCLATTNGGSLAISSLRKNNTFFDKLLGSEYQIECYAVMDINSIISNDPLEIRRIKFVNFDKRSLWYGYCTDESAKTLKINGELVKADKVDIHIDREVLEVIPGVTKTEDKRDYSGYFWFYESVDKPAVELVG
ncbi:MAG: hypothetical protein NC110_02440 [Ruminococcus sp.]|nr:hypothetical protein [Ruminococcus sp.]